MDVFLTETAYFDLKIIQDLNLKSGEWGFIFGHRRGRRFIVEKLFPASEDSITRLFEKLKKISDVFGDRTIGFYARKPASKLKKAILEPGFTGKIFIEIKIKPENFKVDAYLVDYQGKFILLPLACKIGKIKKINE